MKEKTQIFCDTFRAFKQADPYPWQQRLFELALQDRWPDHVRIPTGLGKTAIMSVWACALGLQAQYNCQPTVPRRLVWVVHRRAVVDQATEEAERLASLLANHPLGQALQGLSASNSGAPPLAVSTLRGERADNREWSRDPSRAAIIVGTVDMIGSRLLFSGYGDSYRTRAHHAGLLSSDALIVNDEAHLSPAFARLIGAIARRQQHSTRPLRVLRLSATLGGNEPGFPEDLSEDERSSEIFRMRYRATKEIHLIETQDSRARQLTMMRLALESEATDRTVLFVESPEAAAQLAAELQSRVGRNAVGLLTGEQRGYERDRMLREAPVRHFLHPERPPSRVWLVATSAAEVGIDMTSDRLITSLAPADRLLQRFGRLNRFAETRGKAFVVYVPPKDREPVLAAALGYLRSLPDASPSTVFANPPPPGACETVPAMAELQPWLIERWANTSLTHAARPAVDPWLHGNQEDLPRTELAWRLETPLLAAPEVDPGDREKAIHVHRVLAHETLQMPTSRLLRRLQAILQADPVAGGQHVLLRSADGEVRTYKLRDLVEQHDRELPYSLLLLPPGVGTLQNATLAVPSDDVSDAETAADVADLEPVPGSPARRARFLAKTAGDGEWLLTPLSGDSPPMGPGKVKDLLAAQGWMCTWEVWLPQLAEADQSEDSPPPRLIYARPLRQTQKITSVRLEPHTQAVAEFAARLAKRCGLDPEPFRLAGLYHDLGKRHPRWQAAMGGDPECPVAKPERRSRPRLLGGMRHELVSLLDAPHSELDELALHLIASHHGWARPHFRPSAADPHRPEESERAIHGSALRFARLQERYGPWGLAWREAIFRAADWLISAELMPAEEESEDDA